MTYSPAINMSIGDYTVSCATGLPLLFDEYTQRAALVDRFALDAADGELCCIAVSRGPEWPFIIVAQRYAPGSASGFCPGVLLAPDTHRLFVGAGERILAYDLTTPKRLWEDRAEIGFWGWARHGDYVIMSAELELAAWTATGEKLSSSFVEPPWHYTVEGDTVHVEIVGERSSFSIRDGRPAP